MAFAGTRHPELLHDTDTSGADGVYADTSVYGGVMDDEFSDPSRVFFNRVSQGRFELVISPLVADELEQAPRQVRSWFERFRQFADVVDVTEEAMILRRAYLDAGILTPKWSDDALHVALASVSDRRLIVSWNFRHIVHYQKIPLYNAVNVLHRYEALDIRSPLEVIEDDE